MNNNSQIAVVAIGVIAAVIGIILGILNALGSPEQNVLVTASTATAKDGSTLCTIKVRNDGNVDVTGIVVSVPSENILSDELYVPLTNVTVSRPNTGTLNAAIPLLKPSEIANISWLGECPEIGNVSFTYDSR